MAAIERILFGTDGSREAEQAARAAVDLAAALGTELVGIHVAPPFRYPYVHEFVPPVHPTVDEYEAAVERVARDYLRSAQTRAARLQIPFTWECLFNARTVDTIIDTAHRYRCRLIVIGAHGRGGVLGYVAGSVASRVLADSDISVLVHRNDAWSPADLDERRRDVNETFDATWAPQKGPR